MLNFLSSSNQKQIVGVSLTPGIGLEIAVVDQATRRVLNYGRKRVEYNFSTREIQNYGLFKSALAELMEEIKIPEKSQAYLVLPNVFFDFAELPIALSDSEIKTALLSKAEEFYLFKKEIPVSGYCEVVNFNSGTQKRLAYSSIQQSALDEIRNIFAELKLNLIGVENAYTATLRGLNVCGLLDDIFLEESSWTTMVINTNSFCLFHLDGKNLIDYQEVPLAIKSFSPEEAYQAIVSSSAQLLSSHVSSNLFIISQTDDISAEALKKIMQFDRDIIAIDANRYAKKSLMDIVSALDFNEANSMTPAVLGATSIKSSFGLILNALADDPSIASSTYGTTVINGKLVEINAEFVQKVCIMISLILGVILGGVAGATCYCNSLMQDKISGINSEISQIEKSIKALEGPKKVVKEEIDMTIFIDQVANANISAINFYDSIATDIPKNVWLTKYYNKAGDKILIRGVAENIVDIYEYYKNLRVVSPKSNIILNKLEVVTYPDGSRGSDKGGFLAGLEIDKDFDRLYSFEIMNVKIELDDVDKKYQNKNESVIINKEGAGSFNVEEMAQQMKPTR